MQGTCLLKLTSLECQPTGAHVQDHIELHNICLGPDNLTRAPSASPPASRRRGTTPTSHRAPAARHHHPDLAPGPAHWRRHGMGIPGRRVRAPVRADPEAARGPTRRALGLPAGGGSGEGWETRAAGNGGLEASDCACASFHG